MENSKELFVKAFIEAENLDNLILKKEEDIEWNFSKSFESSMNKLIKKNNRIKISTRLKIRKGLIAAIIAIIVLFTGIMNVTATRTPFIEFIKKVFPQFNQVSLSEESTPPVDRIETEYTLTVLPDGFEIKEYQKDDLGIFTVWQNKFGEEIVFSQDLLELNLSIDTEHNYKELTINGYEAYLNTYEFETSLKWSNGYYWFILKVPNSLGNEIIHIAENISEKNK